MRFCGHLIDTQVGKWVDGETRVGVLGRLPARVAGGARPPPASARAPDQACSDPDRVAPRPRRRRAPARSRAGCPGVRPIRNRLFAGIERQATGRNTGRPPHRTRWLFHFAKLFARQPCQLRRPFNSQTGVGLGYIAYKHERKYSRPLAPWVKGRRAAQSGAATGPGPHRGRRSATSQIPRSHRLPACVSSNRTNFVSCIS